MNKSLNQQNNIAGFHPWTSIKLINGTYIYIKDAKIGDTLSDGSIILSVKLMPNVLKQTFYTIKNTEHNGEHIFVTDLLKVFDQNKKEFIYVKDYVNSGPTIITYENIIAIKTDTEYIKIGYEIFKV